MGEYIASKWIGSILNTLINVLASIPSVIFGLWGLETVVPFVRTLAIA